MDILDKDQLLSDLLKKRVIYIPGTITGDMAHQFGIALAWLNAAGNDLITIYIDSGGGDIMAGLDMYDALRTSKAPTVGIVYRRANSAASVILQGCTKRQIMGNAGVLIHHIRVKELPLDKIEDDPEKALQHSRAIQKRINGIYQERTGKSIREIEETLRAETSMNANESLAFGLVDEII